MKAKTVSQTIAASPARVYAYASDAKNLPHWVPSFFKSIKRDDGGWIAESPLGDVGVEFVHDNDLGVLDHIVTLPSGARLTNPMRVIANDDGSEVLFTLLQHAGMTDAQLEEDAELVRSDLDVLRRLLESENG